MPKQIVGNSNPKKGTARTHTVSQSIGAVDLEAERDRRWREPFGIRKQMRIRCSSLTWLPHMCWSKFEVSGVICASAKCTQLNNNLVFSYRVIIHFAIICNLWARALATIPFICCIHLRVDDQPKPPHTVDVECKWYRYVVGALHIHTILRWRRWRRRHHQQLEQHWSLVRERVPIRMPEITKRQQNA